MRGALNCTADAESRIRDRSDWMLHPNIFRAISHQLGPLKVDLFADNPTSLLCELETRPESNDNRCFHHVLERTESLCQPTMESCGKGPLPSLSTGSRSDPGGTSVENSAVVPGDTGNVQRLSTTNTPETGSNLANSPTGNARCSPQLAVWSISGNITKSNNFRSYRTHACIMERKILKSLTHNSRNGLAHAVQGVQIPFYALSVKW